MDLGFSLGTISFCDDEGNEHAMTNIGFLENIAVGFQYNRLRFELALQGRIAINAILPLFFGQVSTFAASAGIINGYYDCIITKDYAVYIGAGAGIDSYELKTERFGKEVYKDNGDSCVVGIYMGFTWTRKKFSIDTGINFYYIDKPKTKTVVVPKIGFRYAF